VYLKNKEIDMADEKESAYIGFQIEPELKEKFEEKLVQDDLTASQKIRQMIRIYVGQENAN
jgi:hypothetical protein